MVLAYAARVKAMRRFYEIKMKEGRDGRAEAG
jgi:hypothetical protein